MAADAALDTWMGETDILDTGKAEGGILGEGQLDTAKGHHTAGYCGSRQAAWILRQGQQTGQILREQTGRILGGTGAAGSLETGAGGTNRIDTGCFNRARQTGY
jgi:hypothetical protein